VCAPQPSFLARSSRCRSCLPLAIHPPSPLPQTLGLQQYAITFAKQELDLTCLHVVTADELSEIGVTDRLHQVRGGEALLRG
jgi:hypothetical protein